MPIRKKNRLRNRIIFWTLVLVLVGLMIYVPSRQNMPDAPVLEYELY